MNILILLLGFAAFFACIIAHVLVWNLRYPKNRPAALFIIFLMIPSLVLLTAILAKGSGSLVLGLSACELTAAALLHFSLSSAYILTYPAMEALSPSLAIALIVGRSSKGVRHGELSDVFRNELLLGPRVNDLLQAGLVREERGWLTLAPKGRLLVGFFVLLRKFLGLSAGRG